MISTPQPRVEHAQPVGGVQRRDRKAGTRPHFEQAFPGQPLDRLAHRRAAEPETLDQRALGGDARRRQLQRDDHALQRIDRPSPQPVRTPVIR